MTADEKTLETISRMGRFSKTGREKFKGFPSSPSDRLLLADSFFSERRAVVLLIDLFSVHGVSRSSALAVNR